MTRSERLREAAADLERRRAALESRLLLGAAYMPRAEAQGLRDRMRECAWRAEKMREEAEKLERKGEKK